MSEAKGIKSLLKYRYQRKESEKIPANSGSDGDSQTQPTANSATSDAQSVQNGIQGPGSWYSLPSTPNKSTTETVPDTPESQRPSPGSPVFTANCFKKASRFKRGIMVLASDSESEDDPTSPVKVTIASPRWLSKKSIDNISNGYTNSSRYNFQMHSFWGCAGVRIRSC